MLAKAVRQHDRAGPPSSLKNTTLSQSYKRHSHPLKPTPASDINAARQTFSPSSNPLKRTASQASAGIPAWSSQEDMGRKKSSIEQARSSTDSDRLGKLHVQVSFDENDFEDDDDIDLDEASPSTLKNSYPEHSSLPTLTTGTTKASVTPRTPASSAPLAWSSSPDHHKLPAKVNLQAFNYSEDKSERSEPRAAPNRAIPTKRRTLPWQVEAAAEDQVEDMPSSGPHSNAVPAHVQKIIKHNTEAMAARKASGAPLKPRKPIPDFVQDKMDQSKKRKAREKGLDGFTPLPKDKSDSPYPWNTTASAVKEEQKKLRQGHRKLVKDREADPEVAGKAAKAAKKQKDSVHRVFLSEEQKSVLSLVSEKQKSVFFTGSAGTGKSVLMREIIKVMRDKYKREPDRIAVTASTGLAACNVGGVTLHSFAGIGLGKEETPELVRKIKRNQKTKNRWMRTKVLIIDEISMVDGELFDKLESIARIIRNNGRPFGGIQLVITGDFFQLPPVPDYNKVAKFSFDAATWNTSIEHTIGLTHVFRQKDPVFANMLNEMRLGRLTPKSIDAFKALSRPLGFQENFQATELFPTRNEVDYANNARMKNLSGTEFEFKAEDTGSITDVEMRTKLLSNCMASPSIKLKKGAMVMLIKNIDDTLVNGSVGKVIAFMDEKTFDYYHEDEDEFQAVENLEMDSEEMTASRKKLKALLNTDGNTGRKWPLVRFTIADGTSRDLLCQRESWKIELPSGEVQASRAQIPLILAWALSIHKAQGQTLERVKVDLGKIFEKGQAYVALSRATCQEGLQISRFDPKKVMAHDRVQTFYAGLYSAQEATTSVISQAKPKTKGASSYEEELINGSFEDDEDAWAAMAAM